MVEQESITVHSWPSRACLNAGLRELELHWHEMGPDEQAIVRATMERVGVVLSADQIVKVDEDMRDAERRREWQESFRRERQAREEMEALLVGPRSEEIDRMLARIFDYLRPRERRVFELRYGTERLSYKKIGILIELSGSQVRNIHTRAIQKLIVAKQRIDQENADDESGDTLLP